ncbi:hypothetical protein [Streptomyces sp. SM11]|uniref:hypothetical protein n=1 Tax=Streptomyces sp. SM11 TaxID=565557 RepID=UPI0015E15C27|nr:hypothetical protein [Streptomyces sp. SM11]
MTHDFPPRQGGVETVLHAMTGWFPRDSVVAHTSAGPGAAAHDAALPHPAVRDPARTVRLAPGADAEKSRVRDGARDGVPPPAGGVRERYGPGGRPVTLGDEPHAGALHRLAAGIGVADPVVQAGGQPHARQPAG